MKRLRIFAFLFAMMAILASCEEEQVIETPGNIPGMGDTPGEIAVSPFDLPEGIELISLSGEEPVNGSVAAETSTWAVDELKSATNGSSCYGSGGIYVKVKITMRNTNATQRRTCFFPRGLILEVQDEVSQHGMLPSWVWICFEPNETRTFILDLYCLNKDMLGSRVNTKYKLKGICQSKIMWTLLHKIGWKKVNFEHYRRRGHVALKSESEPTYEGVTSVIQESVWAITNGVGLTEEHVEYIDALPELDTEAYPQGLDDVEIEFPYYFDEYTDVE